MEKDLINILYNPGSIQTCVSAEMLERRSQQLTERDYELLKVFEGLVVSDDLHEVEMGLIGFRERLAQCRSHQLTSVLLREFNGFLQRTSTLYENDLEMYAQCFKTIMVFKSCIDETSAQSGMLSQTDWVELEKSLYTLAVWDEIIGTDTMEFMQQSLQ